MQRLRKGRICRKTAPSVTQSRVKVREEYIVFPKGGAGLPGCVGGSGLDPVWCPEAPPHEFPIVGEPVLLMVWVLGPPRSQLRFRLPLKVYLGGERGRCRVERQRPVGDLVRLGQGRNRTLPWQRHLDGGTGAFLIAGQNGDERRRGHPQGGRRAGGIQRSALLSVRLTGRGPDRRGAKWQFDGHHASLILPTVTRHAWLGWRQSHQARSQKQEGTGGKSAGGHGGKKGKGHKGRNGRYAAPKAKGAVTRLKTEMSGMRNFSQSGRR
jgi:hypothetical protein